MQKQLELLKKECKERGIILVEDYDAKLSDSAIARQGDLVAIFFSKNFNLTISQKVRRLKYYLDCLKNNRFEVVRWIIYKCLRIVILEK